MSRRLFLPLDSVWRATPNVEKFQQMQKAIESKKKSIAEWYLRSASEEDQTTESRVTIRTLRFSPA